MNRLLLFGLTFLLLFGWKVTASADLIFVVAAGLVFWVYLASDVAFSRVDKAILVTLLLLAVYSGVLVVLHGAGDVQIMLRSLRALINYAGAAALVGVFHSIYYDRAPVAIVRYIYWALVAHAVLICLMFQLAGLREAIYSLASTYEYVNRTAPMILGLRIPGLTYGLAGTSVVQLAGVLLLPAMLDGYAGRGGARLAVWIGAVLLMLSMLLTGRSGLLLGAALVPLTFLLSKERRLSFATVRRSVLYGLGLLILAAAVVGVIGIERLGQDLTYNLKQAEEVLEFFSEGGSTATTRQLGGMYFLPSDPMTLLFGSSNLGRGELGYIPSDVGYVQLIFGGGLLGLALNMAPYFIGLWLCVGCYASGKRSLAAGTALILLSALLFNFKELSLLTRNHWSIQSLLIATCALQMLGERGRLAFRPHESSDMQTIAAPTVPEVSA